VGAAGGEGREQNGTGELTEPLAAPVVLLVPVLEELRGVPDGDELGVRQVQV
jgi:hypothetical protein